MKTRLAFAAFTLWLAGGVVLGGGADLRKELKELQGTWSTEKDGKSASMVISKKDFTFTMTAEGKKGVAKGTVTIDPAKNPKHIDFTIKEGDGEFEKYAGKTSVAIYELKGDTLRWSANEPGKDARPTAFPEKDGDSGDHLTLTLKREKK
ncbi:MAG: TIGR03067 domain-containing protein [Gemmataceae bacterium]|nr:TIGR03067 domain-containing protein [Gemmataceae bacterium]MCI0741956.1 TIGR03067 domain-containing protein [Gemmataceae bacterium]